MVHNMKLSQQPFDAIKSGKKIYELRLFDDKRRNIDINDRIIFTNLTDENKQLAVIVKAIFRFELFRDVFENLDSELCGFDPNTTVEEACIEMRKYYSEENENYYGVAAIKVELTELESTLEEKRK